MMVRLVASRNCSNVLPNCRFLFYFWVFFSTWSKAYKGGPSCGQTTFSCHLIVELYWTLSMWMELKKEIDTTSTFYFEMSLATHFANHDFILLHVFNHITFCFAMRRLRSPPFHMRYHFFGIYIYILLGGKEGVGWHGDLGELAGFEARPWRQNLRALAW